MSEEQNNPIDAAVAEAENHNQKVEVLGKSFTLTKGFTTAAAYHLDKAQKEESLSGLVDAFSKIISREDRDGFLEHVLSEPEDGEEVSLDDFFTLFTDAITKGDWPPFGHFYLLTGVLRANYGPIEAHYSSIDILGCTARKALNLTEAWLMSVVSPEDWEEKFKPILASNSDDEIRLAEMREKWGDPDEQGRGEFVLIRNDEEQPVKSNFNMGSAPKP